MYRVGARRVPVPTQGIPCKARIAGTKNHAKSYGKPD